MFSHLITLAADYSTIIHWRYVALKESDKSRQYEISNFELYNILDGELLCVEVILEEQRPNTVVMFLQSQIWQEGFVNECVIFFLFCNAISDRPSPAFISVAVFQWDSSRFLRKGRSRGCYCCRRWNNFFAFGPCCIQQSLAPHRELLSFFEGQFVCSKFGFTMMHLLIDGSTTAQWSLHWWHWIPWIG